MLSPVFFFSSCGWSGEENDKYQSVDALEIIQIIFTWICKGEGGILGDFFLSGTRDFSLNLQIKTERILQRRAEPRQAMEMRSKHNSFTEYPLKPLRE